MFPLPSETISSVKFRAVFLASQEGAIRKNTRVAAGLKDAFGAPAPSLKVLPSFKSEAYAKAESDFADYFARNYPGPFSHSIENHKCCAPLAAEKVDELRAMPCVGAHGQC
jgi:hypothetical protein